MWFQVTVNNLLEIIIFSSILAHIIYIQLHGFMYYYLIQIIWIKSSAFKYICTQPRHKSLDVTQGSFQSRVKLIWIQSFRFPRLVAKSILKNLICSTTYLLVGRAYTDSCLSQGHKREVKRKWPRPGFKLKLLIPLFMMRTANGFKYSLPKSVMDMTLNNFMLRLQWCWSFGKYVVPLHCYRSRDQFGPER